MHDTTDFDTLKKPEKIIKYENEETLDPHTGYTKYAIKVWFEAGEDKFLYEYSKDQCEVTGNFKVHSIDHVEHHPHH